MYLPVGLQLIGVKGKKINTFRSKSENKIKTQY
jgi:hypothetical protein